MSESGTCGCGKASNSCAAPAVKAETKPAKAGAVAIQNGKGDAPRNISEEFRSNYNGIKWSTGGRLAKGERFVKKY
ncbi:MAG: hypothetical protein HC904_07550 [Blastochloris sp.]|nr:hypothetical protein [Blastochloris sp.]